jgi:putative hydrolase of the HAD superfamily
VTVRTVLLDFFGTLVDYSPSRTEQGYLGTDALLRDAGLELPYEAWLAEWVAVSEELDAWSATELREYSMGDVGRAFAARVGLGADDGLIQAVIDSMLAEWNTGVSYLDGLPQAVDRLADRYRLAVVTNTHDTSLVPGHLAAMGVDHHLDVVVASVEVGWRKPHPAIYEAALERIGADVQDTVFVGDNPEADYHGPRTIGMRSLLIDPADAHGVPAADRLTSVLELPERLACW